MTSTNMVNGEDKSEISLMLEVRFERVRFEYLVVLNPAEKSPALASSV